MSLDKQNLITRIITASILVAAFVAFEAWALSSPAERHVWLQGLAIIISALVVWETASLLNKVRRNGAVILLLVSLGLIYGRLDSLAYVPVVLAVLVLLSARGTLEECLRSSSAMLVALWFCWLCVPAFVYLPAEINGVAWVAWLVTVVATNDIAAYAGGKIIGGPKLAPAISPGKTISGAVCGLFGGLIAARLMTSLLGLPFLPLVTVLGLIAVAQMSDLAKSILKRLAGQKDSSNLIPGHGGFLDRFDGMLGAALTLLALLRS